MNFTQFIAYFRSLATAHVDIKDFVHGPTIDIVQRSRSEIKYPCLWLETPSLALSDNGRANTVGHRQSAIIVLTQAADKDYEERDVLWADTESIMIDVLAKIYADRKSNEIFKDFSLNNCRIEPISTLTFDHDIGWRTEFSAGNPVAINCRPNKFTEAP
jgi:hypothetical protein